ncbi:hypothetical protein [Bradyrhizobium sp.]|uniref:hypothetical protein n=1 Tax=Bradyrhizobium sp. TaxID=376 RepID=UPI003C311E1B
MATQAILRLLISEYGVALRLPAGSNQIAAHIAQETGLAQGTLLGILNGSTERINENTRRRLADFFNRVAVPQIQAVWLSSPSVAEFEAQRAQSSVIPLTMPTEYRPMAAALQNWLCGVHIAYRYSLDFIDTGDVAREVVYIWNNDSVLQFRMSFVNPSGGEVGPVHYHEGPVLLVGRTAVLIGMNVEPKTAQHEYDRARIIFIDHDHGGGDTHDCKIGLMTSTRPRRDHAPCTASTILLRAQWKISPALLDRLMVSGTVIRSMPETIEKDFGTAHASLIRLFLDNRPAGYPIEPELEPYVKSGPRPERVLRLDTERFATHMRHILTDVVANDAICAPFKENWVAQMQG